MRLFWILCTIWEQPRHEMNKLLRNWTEGEKNVCFKSREKGG